MKTAWTQIKSLINAIMASPEIHYDDVTRLYDELLVPLQKKSEDFEKELQKKIDTIYQENCIDPKCAGLLNCQYCIECGAAHRVNDLKEILGLKITKKIKRLVPKNQQTLM